MYTFIIGLIAHAFQFLNFNASHDFAIEVFANRERHLYQIALGRVLEPFYRKLTGSDTSMPWTAGCLALVWIALAVFLTAKMLHLEKKHEIFLLSGIFVTNQTVICILATYIPWLGADMFALFCATAAAFIWQQATDDRRFRLLPLGALFIAVSLGMYPGFITVAVVLIMLCCIRALLDGRKSTQVVTDGLCGVGMLAVGGGLYYLLMKIICALTGVSLVDGSYNTVSNLWDNAEPLSERILNCYDGVKQRFFDNINSVYPTYVIRAILILLIAVALFFIIRQAVTCRLKPSALLLLTALILLLPFGANAIRFLNPIVHDLMIYAFWILYLLPLIALQIAHTNDDKPRTRKLLKGARAVVCVLLCVIVYSNIQTANLAYVIKTIEHQSTLSAMTNVLYDMEHAEGYTDGETPVVFIGSLGNCVSELPEKFRVAGITGLYENSAVTYDFQSYLQNMMQKSPKILNYSYDPAEYARYQSILNHPALADMPIYPSPGYIRKIDDVLVVKFY